MMWRIALPGFTPGTIRHFMATMVRREKPPVPKEQRDVWLGHDEKRTANTYEAFDLSIYGTACKLRAKLELKGLLAVRGSR